MLVAGSGDDAYAAGDAVPNARNRVTASPYPSAVRNPGWPTAYMRVEP
jgi:hypothetical protein